MEKMKSFGRALKEVREMRGLDIQDVKGIHPITYLQYENDELEVSLEDMDMLAKAIGSSLSKVYHQIEKDNVAAQVRDEINHQLFRVTYSEGRLKHLQKLSEMVERNHTLITKKGLEELRKSIMIMEAIDNQEVSPLLEKMSLTLWNQLDMLELRGLRVLMIQINLLPALPFKKVLSVKDNFINEVKKWHDFVGNGRLDQRLAIEIGKIQEKMGDLEGASEYFHLAVKSADSDGVDGYFGLIGRYYCARNDFLRGEATGEKIHVLISLLKEVRFRKEVVAQYEEDWKRTQRVRLEKDIFDES